MSKAEKQAGAEYYLPIRLVSVLNTREHWGTRHRRAKAHRMAAMIIEPHPLPCVVSMVRVGGKPMDSDNLQAAFKALRDGIADRLGVDDADDRVKWEYSQKESKHYGAIVRIEPTEVER